jgi:hypothetical protein
MNPHRLRALVMTLILAAAASPALAWPGGGWGNSRWGGGPYGSDWNRGSSGDSREGRVSVDRFRSPDAGAALSQLRIAVVAAPGGTGDEREAATFEAAVLDQLAKAGYDTVNPDPNGGLLTDVHMVRDAVVPEEARHNPVSGEMEAGVSNRGSFLGGAIAVDMTKPRKALIDTRLEAHIRDRASGKLLWEGRADIVTREGDAHWTDTAIAGRLAGALFEHFDGPPHRN